MNTQTDQIVNRTNELFEQGFCCSESVLQAVTERHGITSPLIPRIATGLCGGISRSGGICGAVSGGVLAISVVSGRSSARESREENHRLVRTFLNECENKFGSTNCEKLLGCRLDTPEGQKFFADHKLREKCAGFTREAAQIAARVLDENRTGPRPNVL